MTWAFLNHRFVPSEEASIPINDRGFLYGDGVFTSVKVEDGNAQHLVHHCRRITEQCKKLRISPPEIKEDHIKELIKRNDAGQGIWKLKIIVTGGCVAGLSLPGRGFGTYLITLEKYSLPLGKAQLCRYPYLIETPLTSLKTLAYLPRLLVKQYALDKELDDAVVCSVDGWVLETAFANLYWEEDGQVFTPPLSLPLLAGTYLASINNLKEERITYEQLREKQAVFMCNAMGTRSCELN